MVETKKGLHSRESPAAYALHSVCICSWNIEVLLHWYISTSETEHSTHKLFNDIICISARDLEHSWTGNVDTYVRIISRPVKRHLEGKRRLFSDDKERFFLWQPASSSCCCTGRSIWGHPPLVARCCKFASWRESKSLTTTCGTKKVTHEPWSPLLSHPKLVTVIQCCAPVCKISTKSLRCWKRKVCPTIGSCKPYPALIFS